MGKVSHWDVGQERLIYEKVAGSSNLKTTFAHSQEFESHRRGCLRMLGLTFHELQLMRIEHRPTHLSVGHLNRTKYRTELLLGDIHTSQEKKASYRPTAYQPHVLLNAEKVSYLLIHSADPQSRPVVITIFTHVVLPHFSQSRKTKHHSSENSDRYWAGLWVWPSGSLMTSVLSTYQFVWSICSLNEQL